MLFAVAALVALAVAPLAARVATATGLVDRPVDPELKIHSRPIPILGGAAVIIGLIVAQVVLGPWLPLGVAIACAVAFLLGTWDDVRPASPALRVAVLGAAGVVLWAGTASLRTWGAIGAVLVCAAVVATANAVNLLDGQDGLAGGVGAIAALGAGLVLLEGGRDHPAGFAFALAGGLVGFLFWNRPPARIYLGDGGAYATGTALGACAALLALSGRTDLLIAAAALMAVFVVELAFTIARRAGSRSALTAGDRLHSYDLAADRWGRPAAMVALWTAAAVAAAGAFAAAMMPTALAVAVAIAVYAVLGAGVFYLWKTRSTDATNATEAPGTAG